LRCQFILRRRGTRLPGSGRRPVLTQDRRPVDVGPDRQRIGRRQIGRQQIGRQRGRHGHLARTATPRPAGAFGSGRAVCQRSLTTAVGRTRHLRQHEWRGQLLGQRAHRIADRYDQEKTGSSDDPHHSRCCAAIAVLVRRGALQSSPGPLHACIPKTGRRRITPKLEPR
jgi:hypothetical protein